MASNEKPAASRLRIGGLLLASCAVSLALAGCGYQFKVEGSGPTIGAPSSAKKTTAPAPRMVVSNFDNKTFEPNIELKFTTYTRHEFSAGAGVEIVNERADADLALKGEVLTVVMPSLSFTPTGTYESRVMVTIRVFVEDTRSGKVVWDQKATASSEFFITNDLQFNRVLQTRALEQAGRYIAEDLATRFLSFRESGAQASAGPPAP